MRTKLPEKRSGDGTGDFKDHVFNLLDSHSSSGSDVNERTALNVAAVTACVGLLADMVAKLPIYLYKPSKGGPIEIEDHPAVNLVGRNPSEMHTAFELRQLMETGKGLGGNGYARVYRDVYGEPRAIQWIEPCSISPKIVERPNGERYPVYHLNGSKESLTRYDIIHVRGLSRDGIMGLSPVRLLRESIGTSLAQTAKAGGMMKNGTNFPGFLLAPAAIPQDKLNDARREWDANQTGINSGRIPMIHGGWDFKQTNGMTMVDVQFLESRRFEIQEIARIYRIPSFLVGDSTSATTWGSGIEQQTLGFLNFCLDPHLVGWEQSLGMTLLTTQEQRKGFYFQFDRDELANVALEARANFYQTMRNIGAFSPNDVLRKQGEPLISAADGGDDYGRPFNASGGTPKGTAKPEPELQEP